MAGFDGARRLVRSYMRLRYFPRLIVSALRDIRADVADNRAAIEALGRERAQGYLRAAASIDDVQAEIASFCDGAVKALMASNRTIAGFGAQLDALRDPARRSDPDPERAALQESLRRQAAELSRLKRIVEQQARLLPSMLCTPDDADRVRRTLGLLQPMAVEGPRQVRVGRDGDGGYVMVDDFERIGAVLSLGIGDDASWDDDIAARGMRVLQFDPTVAGPPTPHRLFSFERLRIGAQDGPGVVTLDSILRTRLDDPSAALLLKMDIEGDEWAVLEAVDEAALRRFRQIVCEFHDLDRLGEDAFGARAHSVLAKLARTHIVTHVHGNNCGNFANVGNVVVPQSLEVSFALRGHYAAHPATTSFPTALDRPNQPGRADLFLGPFRFGADWPMAHELDHWAAPAHAAD